MNADPALSPSDLSRSVDRVFELASQKVRRLDKTWDPSRGTPVFTVGAAGGSTIPTTILQTILNHVEFGMSLPAALAALRVSQRNYATSLAEPAFFSSALAKQLTSEFGEQFSLATGPILPLDHYPGDATGLAFLGHGRIQAVAEPVRLFGGSALVVHPQH